MRQVIAAFAILMLCGVDADRGAWAEDMQIAVDGYARAYLIERPNTTRPSPTVIMLHGANGTAGSIAQQTNLARLGPQEGFVTVFPQSRANVWNRFLPGRESPQAIELFRRFGGPPNDIGFLKMLVGDLVRRGIADPARIYLAGLSNGGFMTLSMFCFEPGLIAGIGLIVTSMPDLTGEECRPAKPLPVVIMNGTADVVVPYRGGPVARLNPQDPPPFSVWSTDRLESYFRRVNGCPQSPEAAVLSGPQAQRIEVNRSTSCAGGPVHAYRVVGGTHGSVAATLNTGKVLLDFFRASAAKPIAAQQQVINRIKYRRFDGPTLVTGDVSRTAGNVWLETNTRGSRWTFRSTTENSSEIILYDASRDIYVRMDIPARKMLVRKGATQPWALLADISAVEN
jgi:polyhydroxybutyrate depolymerase